MGRVIKKSVVLLLVFMIVMSGMPLQAIAEQQNQTVVETTASQDDGTVEQTDDDFEEDDEGFFSDSEEYELGEDNELIKERTETTKQFLNEDGTITENVYFEPIHLFDEETEAWEDISSDLVSDGEEAIVTENTDLLTTFKPVMEQGRYVDFQKGKHTLSMSLLHAVDEDGEVLEVTDATATYDENEIIHAGVFPQIDLRHITFNQHTKEDLILEEYTGYHQFVYNIDTDLEAVLEGDGAITFVDASSEKMFDLPKPYMSDSNYDDGKGESVTSEAVTYELEERDGGYQLTVNADREWLTDEERVYPVYIDPTTSVNMSADAFVMSAYPTTNYSTASSKWDSATKSHVLKVGNYDKTTGTTFGFLRPNSSALKKHMNISKATLNLHVIHHYYGNNPNGLWLDVVNSSWEPGKLNWNNKPGSSNIDRVNVGRDKPAQFDVTSTVKAWASGSKPNYGFKLHTNGNGKEYWKKVLSTTNATKKPHLSVTYTLSAPDKPTARAYVDGDEGHVTLNWKKVAGATGYKVWIFNGKDEQAFTVGNVDSWSTYNKGIWPTAADIKAGKYTLYTNGKGSQLARDPSPVYKNAKGGSENKKNYRFRVSAIYPEGESAKSAAIEPTIPNLKKVDKPTTKSYSNGDGTGYIDISWSAVPGATGYKLVMYNGKDNEQIDIGNVTSYSTKGKKIWPTPAEIRQGRYKLHLSDNKGAELPLSPSSVYKNSGGNYPDAHDYNIKVIAYNKQGEAYRSAQALTYIPDLDRPKAPNGVAYTNMKVENTGYIMLDWEEVDGAEGYKVWLSNGKTFTAFDVGDVTQWTTQGKGIWPTEADIKAGKSALYTNGKGAELAVDPSPVYKNAGANANAKNYFIKMSAYDRDGETIQSPEFKPSIGTPTEFFGEEDYWTILTVPYGTVNAATGNMMVSEDDVEISGRGPGLGLSRTYNSLAATSGMFGYGWHSDAEMTLKLSGNQALFVDDDSTLHIFTKQADGTYKPPTGVYLTLEDKDGTLQLKTKDQTTAHFSKKTGKLEKLVDGHNNATTYTYQDNRLTTITDASGRKLTLSYNGDGTVKEIGAPEGRKLTYAYEDGRLVSSTDFDGAVTRYGYDEDGKMTSVTEPTHTEDKPVINRYVYENGRLVEAINPRNESFKLAYDTSKRTLLFTQPNGRKLSYTYNAAGNPIQTIEDVDGLKITSTEKYEGNNLVQATDPNDVGTGKATESYEYDKDGNVTKAVDHYGTETYKYNENHDVTEMVDTEGDKVTIAYDGLDAVSETDQSGKTASASKYAKNGNLTEESHELGTAANILVNGQFNDGKTSWTPQGGEWHGATFEVDKHSAGGFSGTQSAKLTINTNVEAHAYHAATQVVDAHPNVSYTFSSLIKTDLKEARAFLNVEALDKDGKRLRWIDNRYSQLVGKNDWAERQLTFTTPANTAKLRVYLEVEAIKNGANAKGTAWFDRVQLERAEVSSSFNPIANSSFLHGLKNWNGTGGTVGNEGFDDNKSVKIDKKGEYTQTVVLNQAKDAKPFDMTLTGLSKADNVKSTKYGLKAKAHYADGTTADIEPVMFPEGTQDWNRAAVKIAKNKPVMKIDVTFFFEGSGTASFDDLRLLEGSVVTKNTYDEQGNYVTKVEDELGYTTTSRFDQYGNELESIDPRGQVKKQTYDLTNQLEQLLLDNGTKLDYTYDKNGNMLSKSIVPQSGTAQTFTYEYDVAGKLLKTVDPLNGVLTHQYDANSNETKTIAPNGSTTEMTYDGTDRMATKSFNGSLAYRYTYDKNGNELTVEDVQAKETKTRTFDKKDRITNITDRGGKQTWTYSETSDKLNSFLFEHGSFKQENKYTYNKKEQNTSMTDGDATYRFDYDEKGNVKTFVSGNGTGATFFYDPRGLVTSLSLGTSTGEPLHEEFMKYDESGNRTEIKDGDGNTITYTYGTLDQLMSETLKDGTKHEYAYDGFGNRVSIKTTTDGKTTEKQLTYNVYNQLTNFGDEALTYDKSGNRLTDGQYTYTWDASDQITAITKKGESTPFVKYRYDEAGRRIQKDVGGNITNYHYDGDGLTVLYETNKDGNVTKSYTYSESGQLVSMKKGNERYFYHYNAHGDVIGITNKAGKRLATYEYDAWGNPLKVEEADEVKDNSYRYAGYQYDRETGMYYLMARYYEPTHGVFLSLDPDAGDDDDILTQNGYSYANNNPVMLVDPDGHWVWLAVNAGFAAYDAYKAYKSGKGWKGAALAAASNFGPGKLFKGAKRAFSAGKKYFKPGKYAKRSIPARSKGRSFTKKERRVMNKIGNKYGCHHCGTKKPGYKNWVPDHQPVNRFLKKGQKQRLYPHCKACSRKQGGYVSARVKKSKQKKRKRR
ncbi:DNRLRE domain-containing protein [Shouchella lonarensis]|uniref:RHS repeat-associated core domain-containing protein n=1 Tax=Shouchella lonarensis TaxID=1464122 RepID=A0A1G6GKJ7_9BACI|nr:DNRLRE domain-containing protein [Shouchella lonarensis]SDB82265.1 RHS repeat-associated core domain-containing protein [Shouchella lonarensis]